MQKSKSRWQMLKFEHFEMFLRARQHLIQSVTEMIAVNFLQNASRGIWYSPWDTYTLPAHARTLTHSWGLIILKVGAYPQNASSLVIQGWAGLSQESCSTIDKRKWSRKNSCQKRQPCSPSALLPFVLQGRLKPLRQSSSLKWFIGPDWLLPLVLFFFPFSKINLQVEC